MGNQEDPCYKFVEFHPSTTGVMTQKTKSSVEFHPSTEFKPNKESKSLWKSNGADPVNATYVIYLEGNLSNTQAVFFAIVSVVLIAAIMVAALRFITG